MCFQHLFCSTPITRFPKISGNELDLHALYTMVINRGGWQKVNAKDDWDDVMEEIGIPKRCINSGIVIKQIYIRFLERYEKVHFLGESLDRNDDEDDDSENRLLSKKISSRNLHATPQTYNHNQHNLTDATRLHHKLGTSGRKPTEYDKLILSLLSPLPNEQDFAVNVCTLMSNEGRHMLKLDKCPRLLNVLLAHAGVYSHRTIRDLFHEYYAGVRRHSLQSFWRDCLHEKPPFLELAYEDFFDPETDDYEMNNQLVARDTLQLLQENEKLSRNEYTELDFLALGRGLGTQEYIGQRILQIATILRNLTFIDENLSTMSQNRCFIRFLVILSNVRWGGLHHLGLDMLGQIAPELNLVDPIVDSLTRCLLSTVVTGLEGADRGVIISCLEILGKVCQKECNEDIIHRCLDKKTYEQICRYLCLNDIMLLLYTLECIYSLSSLGEKSCNQIVHVRGVIDSLVSLVTVEAQSYGPDACILMRVVETIPGNMMAQHHQATKQAQHSVTQQLSIQNEPISSIPATITVQSTPAHDQPQQKAPSTLHASPPTPTTAAANQMPAPASSPVVRSTPSAISTSSTQSPSSSSQPLTPQKEPMQSPNSVSSKHAQQQVIQENEQFAYAWLRATVEPATSLGTRVEQQELYKLYMNASSKIGRRGVLSPIHFPRCVRTIFGGTVGPNQIKVEQNGVEIIQFYYEGLRLRPTPLPVVHKTQVTVSDDGVLFFFWFFVYLL